MKFFKHVMSRVTCYMMTSSLRSKILQREFTYNDIEFDDCLINKFDLFDALVLLFLYFHLIIKTSKDSGNSI